MTIEQFFDVKHQFKGTWRNKHDTIVVDSSGWKWYYYGTLIAKYSDEEVQLYKLKYSTSTTRRHNIVRRYYQV